MSLNQGQVVYIDQTDQLLNLCNELKEKKWIAIDTEFLREKTYRPKLCLIQVATDSHIACIDPLALPDIEPFLDVVFNRNIIKVFHAASQDLEIFYWFRNQVPGPVFDTQIAAPLLGYNEQIGYGNLVKEMLGVTLAKTHSRADWTRRPLPEKQLNYAVDDVVYLCELYLKLTEKLQQLGRSSWLEKDFATLESGNSYDKPESDMWLKVRGVQKFKGKSLAAIQKLTEWREYTAKSSDIPRNWLIKDDIIVDIARQYPKTLADLKHIRGLSDAMHRKHGQKILQLLEDAKSTTPKKAPEFIRKQKLTPAQDAVVDLLTTLVKLESEKLGINPSILAPRKELEALLCNPETSALQSGWREPLIGQKLQDLLDGKMRMYIENFMIIMEPT